MFCWCEKLNNCRCLCEALKSLCEHLLNCAPQHVDCSTLRTKTSDRSSCLSVGFYFRAKLPIIEEIYAMSTMCTTQQLWNTTKGGHKTRRSLRRFYRHKGWQFLLFRSTYQMEHVEAPEAVNISFTGTNCEWMVRLRVWQSMTHSTGCLVPTV